MKKPKIQIPALFYNEVLADKTMSYWKLNQVWNGVRRDALTVADAINTTQEILQDINPKRPLAIRVSELHMNVINFGTRKKMLKDAAYQRPALDTKIIVL